MEQFLSLRDAIVFARRAHDGQRRLDGRAFLSHPLAVLQILLTASPDLPQNVLTAGLLHDTLEDGNATEEQITSSFGEEVKDVVKALTRPWQTYIQDHRKREELYILQMIEANIHYPYVLLIKMADRLHNLETAHFLPRERQEILIHETLTLLLPTFLAEERKQICFVGAYGTLLELLRKSIASRTST
jgi:GTP pyrophosphokinase